MTGTYLDFEGVNLLTGFAQIAGKVLVRNELGGVSNGYELVHADKGRPSSQWNSGYSFGGNQMDLSVNPNGRAILKDILINAKNSDGVLIFSDGGQFYDDHQTEIEAAANPNALSDANIVLITEALASAYGKTKVNEAFKDEVLSRVSYVNNIINTLTEGNIKTSLLASDEMRAYLVDYHNQFSISVNGKMHNFLKGELVSTFEGTPMQLDNMVTSDDIRLFVSRSQQSQQNPTAFNNRYDATADTLLTSGIGKYLSGNEKAQNFVGTRNPDTLIGGAGNDTLHGAAGYDSYRFQPNHGHDTIDDTDQVGEIVFNGEKVNGIMRADKNNPASRWVFERSSDKRLFVMTRATNGVRNLQGVDLVITVDEELPNAQNSVTIKNYDFYQSNPPVTIVQPGAVNPFLANGGSQAGDQVNPGICKIDANRFAEVWFDRNTLRVNGNIYTVAPSIDGPLKVADTKTFSIALDRNPESFGLPTMAPSITKMGTDRLVVGYLDYPLPLIQTDPSFVTMKADILDLNGQKQNTVTVNNFDLYNLRFPKVAGFDNGFAVGYQYGANALSSPQSPIGEMKLYNSNGVLTGSVQKPVGPYNSKHPYFAMTPLSDNRFMYVWGAYDAGGSHSTRAQAFSTADLSPVSAEITVDSAPVEMSVATLSNQGMPGDVIISYQTNNGFGWKRIAAADYSYTVASKPSTIGTYKGFPELVPHQDGGYSILWMDSTRFRHDVVDDKQYVFALRFANDDTQVSPSPVRLNTGAFSDVDGCGLNALSLCPTTIAAVELQQNQGTAALAVSWQSYGVGRDVYAALTELPLAVKPLTTLSISSNNDDVVTLVNNERVNTLRGKDQVTFQGNNNIASGSADQDSFIIRKPAAKKRQAGPRINTITDFNITDETLDVRDYGITDYRNLPLAQSGNNTNITLAQDDTVILQNVLPGELGAANFIVNTVPVTPNAMPVNAPINTPTRVPVNAPIFSPSFAPNGNNTVRGNSNAGLVAGIAGGVVAGVVVLGFAVLCGGLYAYQRRDQIRNWMSSTARRCWGAEPDPVDLELNDKPNDTVVELPEKENPTITTTPTVVALPKRKEPENDKSIEENSAKPKVVTLPKPEIKSIDTFPSELEEIIADELNEDGDKTIIKPKTWTDLINRPLPVIPQGQQGNNVVPFVQKKLAKPPIQPSTTVSGLLDLFLDRRSNLKGQGQEQENTFSGAEVKDGLLTVITALINKREGNHHTKGAISQLTVGTGVNEISLDTLAQGMAMYAFLRKGQTYDPYISSELQGVIKRKLENLQNPQQELKKVEGF